MLTQHTRIPVAVGSEIVFGGFRPDVGTGTKLRVMQVRAARICGPAVCNCHA